MKRMGDWPSFASNHVSGAMASRTTPWEAPTLVSHHSVELLLVYLSCCISKCVNPLWLSNHALLMEFFCVYPQTEFETVYNDSEFAAW